MIEDEEMSEDVADLWADDDVAEYGEDLIGIEHPFLSLEAVDFVESLDLFVHHFWDIQDDFHLVHWRLWSLQLVQSQLASSVRLVINNILRLVFGLVSIPKCELDGPEVEGEVVFDIEGGGLLVF